MPFVRKIVKKFAKQTLTYWPKVDSGPDGKPVYGVPVQIICRWEDKEQEIVLPDSRTIRARAYIIMAGVSGSPPEVSGKMVDVATGDLVNVTTPIVSGSLMLLGLITDWQALPTYPKVPTVNQGAREIIKVNLTPDLKNQEVLFEIYA
jgi:hypothetical protein